jgi:hypothetical protein
MPETIEELLARRAELEVEIPELLELTGSDFELADVLEAIYEEEETDDMQQVIMMFDDGDPLNLNNAVETATDAWNCFPHRILEGKSPAEVLIEYRKTHQA